MKFSTGLIMGIFFGIVVAILSIIILFLGFTKEDGNYILEVVRVLFSGGIFLTVIAAIVQIRQNAKKNEHDKQHNLTKLEAERKWKKKYLAYIKINEYVKDLETQRTLLDKVTIENNLIKNNNDKTISFSDRRNFNSPLTFEEVHTWVCETDDKNNIINADIKSDKCATSIHGAIVVRSLISIINTYEMIATGIKQDMLEYDMIVDVMSNSIVSNFEFMKKYIAHRRTKHDNPDLACEWEILYNDIKKGKT